MTPDKPEQHPLHHLPNELVGRALRDADFRNDVLANRGSQKDLNAYLGTQGYAPLGDEAWQTLKSLDAKAVEAAIGRLQAGSAAEAAA